MKNFIVSLINFYQNFLSFDRGALAIFTAGGACRYEIRCSEYTKQEIIKQGVRKGVIAGVKRIWSCR